MKTWLRGVILLLALVSALVFASAWIASPMLGSRKATDSELLPSTQLPAAERWTLAW